MKATNIQNLMIEELESRFSFLESFSKTTTVAASISHEFWSNYEEDLDEVTKLLVTYASNGGYLQRSRHESSCSQSTSKSAPVSPQSPRPSQSPCSSPSFSKSKHHQLTPWLGYSKVISSPTAEDDEVAAENQYNAEVKKFINICKTINKNSMSMIDFWSEKSHMFPTLIPVAKKFLGIPATSASCERIFSRAGHLINKKRANLKPETVEKILFLSSIIKK